MYSKFIAYLLWFLSGFGVLGFHRFYLGKPLSAILFMCTGGLAGIGSIYDLITLGSQVNEANVLLAIRDNSKYQSNYQNVNDGNWRYVNDGDAHFVHENDKKDSVERRILKLARRKQGILTASETALEANITLDEAKKQLELLVTRGHAEMRIRKSGTMVFTFPEFMDDNSPFEDF
ncbi:hypothetical protein AGMMS50212_12270 [Spirochaetia bacterium]|nr:hypothetical protein AGMMS50212_12270 [Spirochaetia bacterium]